MAPVVNFTGLASGIDSSALIQAMLDQERAARVTPLQTSITKYTDTNDALSELSTLLTKLDAAVGAFRLINGGALAKLASSSDETKISATASNAASNGTYSLNVSQLAENGTLSFDDTFNSGSDTLNNGSGTVSFTVGSGSETETIDISVTSGATTVDKFIASFNAQSDKAEASLVNVGTSASPEYKIVITSNNSGTEQGTLAVSNEALVSASYSLNQAKDSQFTMSGISGTITRSSNIINDVVTGLTFSLNSTGSAKISVADDSTASAAAMQEFVDAYNEVVNFVKENDFIKTEQKDGQNVNTFGPLSSSNLDENLLTALRNALSGAATSGGTVNTLADLGVTTQRDGTLAFNSDTFKDAVVDDSSNARTILSNLGERLGAVDGTIAQFTRFNGLIDSERQSNQHQITSLQTRISDVEAVLSRQEASLTQRFARLEAIMGNLNSQQSTLAALLPQY